MPLRELLDSGDLYTAERVLRQTCVDHPDRAAAWAELARVQVALGQRGAPLHSMLTAIRLDSTNLELRSQMGMILLDHGALEVAERTFRGILGTDPSNRSAVAGLATVLERRGDLQAASALLRPHIATPHARIAALWGTVCRRLGQPEVALPVLETTLREDLVGGARSMVLRELGHNLDVLDQPDAAWAAIEAANALLLGHFDPIRHTDGITDIIDVFDAALFSETRRSRDPAQLPVFIIGLPRSGTSLVEQILDAHPAVTAAGELNELRAMTILAAQRLGHDYPTCIADMDTSTATSLGTAYLDRRMDAAPKAVRVTDKMPQNFMHLGLIALTLPGARIIHCRRNLEDTALSCFFQGFNSTLAWSNRLDWLGSYITGYQRLMIHWDQVLPLPMHTVQYEALVSDPDTEIRRLLGFCGLTWHPDVTCFEDSDRQCNTASYAQVQRGIYLTSLGKSRRYRRQLAPLRAAICGEPPHPNGPLSRPSLGP